MSSAGTRLLPTAFSGSFSLVTFTRGKFELVLAHADSCSGKTHTFEFKAHALFHAAGRGKRDASPGSDHAVPGQTGSRSQSPHHLARGAGITCRPGNTSVCRHFACRNFSYSAPDRFKHSSTLLETFLHVANGVIQLQRKSKDRGSP